MGRDAVARLPALPAFGVSIHAPAWGATSGRSGSRTPRCGFNPRARMGRDIGRYMMQYFLETSFNPRARMGRD